MKKIWVLAAMAAVLFFAQAESRAASISFSGTFTYDSDVALIPLVLNSNSVITIQSYGYGGASGLSVNPGGFAASLSLYDSTGTQVDHDYIGGTAVGLGCSHAGNQDPVTGFCEDPSISFAGISGNYTLALSVQPNDGPLFLADGFGLPAGTNFGAVPFVDPGDFSGQTIRNGNWFVQVDLDGGTAVPEPGSLLMSVAGLATLIAIRRKN